MRIFDSRAPHAGILPLQDHGFEDRGVEVQDRTCLLALRITGRETGKGQIGHYVYDPETAGDLTLAFYWPPDTRPTGAWAWAWPAVHKLSTKVTTPSGGGSGGPSGVVSPSSRPPA
jgi:hypothetical protein